MLVLGLTHSVVALAGRLADEYAGYQGQWRLGIRMDRLRGAVPLDLLEYLLGRPGNPYSREEYKKVTSASTRNCSTHRTRSPSGLSRRCCAGSVSGRGTCPTSPDE